MIYWLTEAGKEEVALALILWKDFKDNGKFDPELTTQDLKLAEILGISDQFNSLISKVPPMKIVPRYQEQC